MFNGCSGFDISGGVFNNVEGNQYNNTRNNTTRVRGANNTYRTINRGSYNVTNNGVTSGWGSRPYRDMGYPQTHNQASSSYDPPRHYHREYEDIQQPQPHPGMPHHSTERGAYGDDDDGDDDDGDDDDDDLYEPHPQWEHYPTPPASAPPAMTSNFDGAHHDQTQTHQSRSGESRAAPAPVQNESSEASSAQQPPQVQRSPVQSSSSEQRRAFPVPGESRGVPRAQVIHHPSPSAQAEMQDQDVNMVEDDHEDGGANAATTGQ